MYYIMCEVNSKLFYISCEKGDLTRWIISKQKYLFDNYDSAVFVYKLIKRNDGEISNSLRIIKND